MRLPRLAVTLLLLLWTCQVVADDLYIIDVQAVGTRLPSSCSELFWGADTVFYNLTAADATITLLGVSNGGARAGVPSSITVPAGRTVSLRQQVSTLWRPVTTDAVWVYHVSAPATVAADSYLFVGFTNGLCRVPEVVTQTFGKTQLPIFHGLVPAGQQQVLTGLTLGDVDSHLNAVVYNGGQNPADATIEIHRACDGVVTATQQVHLAANMIVQVPAVAAPETLLSCTLAFNGANGLNHLAYLVVTVTQPSLSFATVITNTELPVSTIQVGSPRP